MFHGNAIAFHENIHNDVHFPIPVLDQEKRERTTAEPAEQQWTSAGTAPSAADDVTATTSRSMGPTFDSATQVKA